MSATAVGYQTAQYFTVGAMAAVVFDYCLTISQEVQLIWGKKWGVIRVAFTLTRYATLVGAAMTMYAAVTDRSKYTSCRTFNNVSYGKEHHDQLELSVDVENFQASHLISIIAAEGLLIIRTFAFWHQSKKLLVWLLVLAAVCIAGAVGVSQVADMLNIDNPTRDTRGCTFGSGKGSAIQYGFLIIYELVLMILTVYKRFDFYKGARSRLVTTLYRDGMIYMACIIITSFTNILIALVVPVSFYAFGSTGLTKTPNPQGTYTNILDAPQLVIHGVLASRILFNLRHESRQSDSVIVRGSLPLAGMRRTPGGHSIVFVNTNPGIVEE
ncbi:hypothetical protein EDB19DRAFT_2037662 [Suillus lakei]|nr:hypothetical protein EDB19DRAFT_2037662 [Suillus lakei]